MKKVIMAMIVIILIVGGKSIIAKGDEYNNQNLKLADKNSYYEEQEQRFVNVLRSALENEGYINAGVTLSCVMDGVEIREYKVNINHYRFSEFTDEECDEFMEKVSNITFPEQTCKVTYTLTSF